MLQVRLDCAYLVPWLHISCSFPSLSPLEIPIPPDFLLCRLFASHLIPMAPVGITPKMLLWIKKNKAPTSLFNVKGGGENYRRINLHIQKWRTEVTRPRRNARPLMQAALVGWQRRDDCSDVAVQHWVLSPNHPARVLASAEMMSANVPSRITRIRCCSLQMAAPIPQDQHRPSWKAVGWPLIGRIYGPISKFILVLFKSTITVHNPGRNTEKRQDVLSVSVSLSPFSVYEENAAPRITRC